MNNFVVFWIQQPDEKTSFTWSKIQCFVSRCKSLAFKSANLANTKMVSKSMPNKSTKFCFVGMQISYQLLFLPRLQSSIYLSAITDPQNCGCCKKPITNVRHSAISASTKYCHKIGYKQTMIIYTELTPSPE